MTREEAINWLEIAVPIKALTQEEFNKFIEAVNMAIKALEQEPCADAISRVDVLEQINCWIESGEYRYTNATLYLGNRINDLPRVQPTADYQVKPELDGVKTELEQEACDCISRAETLKAFDDKFLELQKAKQLPENKAAESKQLGVNWCINTVKELPSVKPQSPSHSPNPIITIDGIRYIAEEPTLKTVHKDGEVVIGGFKEIV